jgi:hypothetical protein
MLRMQEMAFPGFKFQKFSGGLCPQTSIFSAFFPCFISNTSIVSINFIANLDAQNTGNGIFRLLISNVFWGSMSADPPIHVWYVGHTRGLRPLLYPSNILSHSSGGARPQNWGGRGI